MKAYIFPGQASQFVGMGKDLYEEYPEARLLMEQANEILGFRITDIMFDGSEEDLKQTEVTQPSIFLYSLAKAAVAGNFEPDVVAGHSLGEFTALTANDTLSFQDGLSLVSKRAQAMQKACEASPSTMAAILGLEDSIVEGVCREIDDIVVAANFNCPGQIVISGTISGIDQACEKLSEVGAKRAIKINVGGAFHSPLMEPAKKDLEAAIASTSFNQPRCPVYQNVNAQATDDEEQIKKNLIAQLTSPVLWTKTMQKYDLRWGH